jgi:HSP20 family protein
MTKDRKEKAKKDLPAAPAGKQMSPFEAMDRLFENYFPRGWMRPFRTEWPSWPEGAVPFEGKTPKVDVIDRDHEVVVRAELPGVDKKDIEVSVTRNSATIKGTTSHEDKEEKGNYYRCEMSRGSYSRTVMLPADVAEDRASAKFKDGVLELVLPKREETKRQTISVE